MVPCHWRIVEALVTLYVLLDTKSFLHLSCSITHMLLVTAFAYAVCACYAKGHCMQRVSNAVISVAICYSYYVASYRADELEFI